MFLLGIPFVLVLLLLCGLLLYICITGFSRLSQTRRFLAVALPAEAVVTSLPSRMQRVGTGGGGTVPVRVFEPVVRFQTAQGQAIEARVEVATPTPTAAIGQSTPVLYNPAQPQQVRLAEADGSGNAALPIITGCIAATFGAMALGCIVLMLVLALGTGSTSP